MDFHPVHQSFLLVGTIVGDLELWDIIPGKKLIAEGFRTCKTQRFQPNNMKTAPVFTRRVLWSQDGLYIGVAYSKQVVKVYQYHAAANLFQELVEIHAHYGSVNDLAFSKPFDHLLIITCGDDKLIKAWDVKTGEIQFTFKGHEAPIYSLCSHTKDNVPFLFSTSTIGEIKGWVFDGMAAKINLNSPDLCCMKMAYTADGKRTNKDGLSRLIEWNDSEGEVRRRYLGLKRHCSTVVHFETSKNRILAAGDEHVIKFWDADKPELLACTNANGGLPEHPHFCFNKSDTFLAVFASRNEIKILANNEGLQSLQSSVCGIRMA